ncbi:MAG: hypothetical protein MK213_07015 [Planctomycetes bacterium]|nr:hypothetical protein [Planctomycetota bacterium]
MTQNVLILDNDQALRQLLELAMRQGGIQPITCALASEAEPLLQNGSIQFMLLDLNLAAGESGEVLAQSWHAAGCLPPFFMVTGTPDDPRLNCLEAFPEFRGVIAKPFSILELVEQVRGACAPILENEQSQEMNS